MEESRTPSRAKEQMVRRRLPWRGWLFGLLLAVFLVSGGLLLWNGLRSAREQEARETLALQVHQVEAEMARQGGGVLPTEDGILPQYQVLWEQNPDLFGWVSIPDTAVDYPVMHTAQEETYYLHRAFDGSDAASGTPFLASACFAGCGNYIVYGHNMKDGSLFAMLLDYADPDFYEAHPQIRFDTLEEAGVYEVMAAFYTDMAADGFAYYTYTDLREEAVFGDYLAQVEEAALYPTGVTAEPGDQLLTLSTCSYHTADGRFVVVARRME